ncbi:MAG: radical SAM protein [Thermodesulfobacteriota bacterium]|nr:radical SAM protein [Thermodesulfobacteriota bacterium]
MSFERPQIIRPPSEWKSYYLPLTSGCSNNTCTFCNYYGTKLKVREVEDVKGEIDALALYKNTHIYLPTIPRIIYEIAQSWDGKRIFLQDGDALVYPVNQLIEVLEYLNDRFPSLERIGSYATPRDILRRELDELRELKRLKLSILYQGVETGDEKLLHKIGKGVNAAEMIEAGKRAQEAGITLSVTVILGLGGVEGSERHALETARVLTEIDPGYVGALTLMLVPGTPLYNQWKQGEFSELSAFEYLEELGIIIEHAHFTHCFLSSMHASNYLNVRGTLPHEKEKMLKEVRSVLATRDTSSLRPDFLRGL